ncbi:MAG: DUF3567 domain-containing protein [Rubrivivax sp.]|nr:DUF3567 domain-containing protein [Rubrivivax sp.]
MQMLYNSDSFVVVRFDVPGTDTPDPALPRRGGYEIVDKFARREIFIEGAVAESFKQGVQALVDSNTGEEAFDEFIAGYCALAQQPVTLH